MIRAIRHVGVVVADLEAALGFYRDLLGLEVQRLMDESGAYIDTMLALDNVRVTTVKMGVPGGPALLELLRFESHRRDPPSSRELCNPGPSHIALEVEDLHATWRTLAEAGVVFNAPPQLAPDGGARVTFCLDPEGNPVELVQLLGR